MILNFFQTKDKLLEKDCKITYEYDGLITLEFEIGEDEEVYCEEPFFISGENQFIIKSIDEEVVTCTLDFTSLKKDFYVGQKSFDSLTLNDILHQLLDPVGWKVKNAQSIKNRRTLTVEDESLLSAIFKLEELYNCTFEFDCKNKILKVIDEGADRDYIVSKDINLEKFIIKKDTYEHYTRIYGFGSEGMTFSSINNGKEYVENFNYNKNIIPATFRDDRFTDKLNLKKHCEELLEKHSKPLIEYELSIIELERRDLRLHDIITFLNYKTKKKEKHRIIEITKYSDDETKNEIKFINRTENLSEYLQNRQEQISQEVKKEIGRYDFSSRFDESIKKATSKFEKLLLNGYKIETENGTYYVDQLPKEKAKNVLRIGLGGIMGSSNGWDGPYSLAIGNDGSINADNILTGFLDADRIRSNSITADKLTVKAKEELINGLVTESKYNEFVSDTTKFKSEIGQAIINEVDNIQIGGKNLARNSQSFFETSWETWGSKEKVIEEIKNLDGWNLEKSISFKGIKAEINSNLSGIYNLEKQETHNLKFEENKMYTISFDAINLSNIPFKFYLNGFKKYNLVELKANESKRVILTATKSNDDYSQIGVLVDVLGQEPKFACKFLKVEEGNKATSWTPSFDDLEEIDNKLKSAIEYLESDNNNLLNKLNGLSIENAKMKHELSTNLKQTRDEFLFEFNNYKQLFDENNNLIEQRFNDISRYIRFKNGSIELGDINSPFKTLLTHEKISFLKGDYEVAYMSNERLYITDVTINNSLRIGNFEFVPRENGNLSLRKVVS